MLIQFRVENHRSLRDEQTLSMVASGLGDKADPRLLHPKGLGEALLPAVALYGANESGKSNVLSGLGFIRTAVLDSHRIWEPEGGIPQEPFALSSKANAPSLYELDIFVEGVRYRYGFVLSAARVEEEWLHAWPHNSKQVWLEREGDTFTFGSNLHGENETIRGLTRPNSLFLSAAAQNNHVALLPIFRWFRTSRFQFRRTRTPLASFSPGTRQELGRLFSRGSSSDDARQRDRDAIVQLLQASDTGILDMKVEERDASDLERQYVSYPARKRFSLSFRHRTDDEERAWLPLHAESDGTITLLEIAIRLVRILSQGGLVCIDELEASLHPMMALGLLRLFQDPRHNPQGAQLLFTTHDTNLLGNVLGETPLRRDQVWFTEKDPSGATHLYPLTDIRARTEENLERGYLQGRYGAVPFLGQLSLEPSSSEEA